METEGRDESPKAYLIASPRLTAWSIEMFCRLNYCVTATFGGEAAIRKMPEPVFLLLSLLENTRDPVAKERGFPTTIQNGDRHPDFRPEEPCRCCRVLVHAAA